ncbi:MAG: DNA-processing protein DprA, partial [Deltaproteobacteria bacterium]|nr:DNA-processing protein DprA [Deltaproteobacteria bacterium]
MWTSRLESWLALGLVDGLGPKTLGGLIAAFGEPEAVLDTPAAELCRKAGLAAPLAGRIANARQTHQFRMEKRLIEQHGVVLCPMDSPDYPPLLARIHPKPPLLFIRGDSPLSVGFTLGVVGTRNPTPYGEAMTCRLIEQVAALVPELVVVSGLARGIDTVAHTHALRLGLKTIAVMAGGLVKIYPPENQQLAETICGQGALVTEFPMGAPPLARNFPIRNRIISGLSQAILIPEAGDKSGAIITAGFGLNHGRPVFAVPGNIDSPASAGVNRLLRQGEARMALSGEDILDKSPRGSQPAKGRKSQLSLLDPAVGLSGAGRAKTQGVKQQWAKQSGAKQPGEDRAKAPLVPREFVIPPDYPPAKQAVLRALVSGPRHPDELCRMVDQ